MSKLPHHLVEGLQRVGVEVGAGDVVELSHARLRVRREARRALGLLGEALAMRLPNRMKDQPPSKKSKEISMNVSDPRSKFVA